MHVEIQLESPFTVWTNLDNIKGRVTLQLYSTTSISSIVVKLEGEARTRLVAAARNEANDRPKPREETHKVLYKLATVFPPSALENPETPSRHYTLNPGNYEYPFSFKIPFNNSCTTTLAARPSMFGLDVKQSPSRHVKTTLPPTLTAFPGMAEVRYFLKVTVNRKEFYKENLREHRIFNFLPIEPPRAPSSSSESFARRTHEFVVEVNGVPTKKRSLFGLRKSSTGGSESSTVDQTPPKIRVDARLPTPPIITCNHDVPLRILVKKLNSSPEQLYLQSLHIQLNGLTHIRAHEVARDERSSWVIMSLSNMEVPLRFPKNAIGELDEELILDPVAWKNRPLPNNVAPTFETCNISRSYDIEIRVGIGYGRSSVKNQVMLPLTHQVQVYSGIEPPPALLAAMKKPVPTRKPVRQQSFTSQQANSPVAPERASTLPADAGPSTQPQYAPLPAGEVEPPPSYEDAIAAEIPPVAGERGRNYMPPVPNEGAGFSMDGTGKARRGS